MNIDYLEKYSITVDTIESLLERSNAVIYQRNIYEDKQKEDIFMNKNKIGIRLKNESILIKQKLEDWSFAEYFRRNIQIIFAIIKSICVKNVDGEECCIFIECKYCPHSSKWLSESRTMGFRVYRGIKSDSFTGFYNEYDLLISAKGVLMKNINQYIKLERDLYISMLREHFVKNYKKKFIRIKKKDRCNFNFYNLISHIDWGAEVCMLSTKLKKLQL